MHWEQLVHVRHSSDDQIYYIMSSFPDLVSLGTKVITAWNETTDCTLLHGYAGVDSHTTESECPGNHKTI